MTDETLQTYLTPTVDNLYRILVRLRAPGGCPWDREQTSQTLSRCLAEECAEALEAIDRQDGKHMAEELGDLLMNVVFQAVVAEENGLFSWHDVQRGIVEKMVRRHAHIFGHEQADTPEQVKALWEKIKATEPEHAAKTSVLDGIAKTLSALNYAEKIQKKAAKNRFDWTGESAIVAKIDEELGEVKEAKSRNDEQAVDEELGDLLFSIVNLIRFRKRGTSEELLRAANAKFEQRFRGVEQAVKDAGQVLGEVDTDTLEAYYQKVKAAQQDANHA